MAQEPTQTRVLEALAQVVDPDLQRDVVALGMVDRVAVAPGVDGDDVRVVLLLPVSGGEAAERLAGSARAAVSRVPGVARAEVAVEAALRPGPKEPLPGVKHVVAIGSGKGGVGKSTVASNLAAALALDGAAVGLLDADIYGPSQARMYAVEGRRLMADDEKRILPLRSCGVKVISIANLVEEGQALTWRGPILHGTLTQLVQQTLWGDLDVLIVDLPPGTGDVQLSLAQLVDLTGMALVTTPQDVALMDVRRAATMARKTHVPLLGVVENMAWYELPGGERDYIFGEGGAAAWAEAERLPLLGRIPIARSVRESGDAGTPIVVADPASPQALAFRATARALMAPIAKQARSTLPVL